MELKKETMALMNKLEEPMNLKAQLIDLEISCAKGRYTKEEYDKYVEEIHLSIMNSPNGLIVEIVEEFYRRFHHYFKVEASKERYEKLVNQVYIYQHGYNECTGHEEEEERVFNEMIKERKKLYQLTGYTEYKI